MKKVKVLVQFETSVPDDMEVEHLEEPIRLEVHREEFWVNADSYPDQANKIVTFNQTKISIKNMVNNQTAVITWRNKFPFQDDIFRKEMVWELPINGTCELTFMEVEKLAVPETPVGFYLFKIRMPDAEYRYNKEGKRTVKEIENC